MQTITTDLAVDTRGLGCPLPLLRLKKALQTLMPGQTVWIQATDPASVLDFGVFVEQTSHEMLEQSHEDGIYHYVIRKG
ncbi:sulfurtransferase TusA family protein [Candidatus Woesearchaeota archaeon]|jgi:tRNA 2-thiouridine synthesizing protein A|nr:sulfurtransferase TusA family protein [Candidatus Woesearchaeota archaeon]